MRRIHLIDLSAIVYPLWHINIASPDANAASTQSVAKVLSLASGQPYVAVCADAGRSFRKEIDQTYKANREQVEVPLMHQLSVAIDRLREEGFPVWGVGGFEADDVIASATAWAMKQKDVEVVICSVDKDLLQLVNERVVMHSTRNGDRFDVAAVEAKYGVKPEQLGAWLALVGDESDNIAGAKGIGPKKATQLLTQFGSMAGIFEAVRDMPTKFQASTLASLQEFEKVASTTQRLVGLRRDVPNIDFEEVFQERKSAQTETFIAENKTSNVVPFQSQDDDEPPVNDDDDIAAAMPTIAQPTTQPVLPEAFKPFVQPPGTPLPPVPAPAPASAAAPSSGPSAPSRGTVQESGASSDPTPPVKPVRAGAPMDPKRPVTPRPALRETPPDIDAATGELVVVEREWALEPRSYKEARLLATDMFESRLFSAYGTPQAVLSTIMAGRELGLPSQASLRAFHIVEGKPTYAADFIRALVLRSGKAQYFICSERTNEASTWETQRQGDPKPLVLRYTIQDAEKAQLVKKGSGWEKNPADMLVARASSKLARLVYPDVVHGLYAPEEFD